MVATSSSEYISNNPVSIITEEDEIMQALRQIFDCESSLDICVSLRNPLHPVDLSFFKALVSGAISIGKPVRLVTEIDHYDAEYCKNLQSHNNIQLRHVSNISGLMILGARIFAGAVTFQGHFAAKQLITSSSADVVLQQNKVFNELWNIAIPSEARFKELSSGVTGGKHELIQDPEKVEEVYIQALSSATSQILLLLPSIKAFWRQRSIGLLDLIKHASSHGTEVRVLMPANEAIRQELSQLTGVGNIKIHFVEIDLNSRATIIVIDRKKSLVIEITDDQQEVFRKAIGNATLSTAKSTVLSYTSLFDSYWIHAGNFEKLLRADQLKDEFINIAAHELRTPIMPIVGTVEVLMERLRDPSQQDLRGDIEIIYRNADRLKGLAEDILNVSRIESGNFRLEIAECDMYSLIEESIQEIKGSYAYWSRRQQTRDRGKSALEIQRYASQSSTPTGSGSSLYTMIRGIIGEDRSIDSRGQDEIIVFTHKDLDALEPSIDGSLVHKQGLWVRCDPKKIKQVLYNLFSNALKFTDLNGGGKIFVGATIVDHGQVKISVKDRGTGIDATIMDKMFERFTTKSESGTGLGLYIAKKIVEAHGGTIAAENNIDGRGATFLFTLPLSPYSSVRFGEPQSIDRLSLLQKEIEDRRNSLTSMRSTALQKISEMKDKLMNARDRAVKARDSAIEEYLRKVEASRGLLRVRQELLNEQINYNSMRREIDRRVERGLEGLTTVIENLKGDLAGDETLDRIVQSASYTNFVDVEAQRIIGSDFFKSIQKQLGIDDAPKDNGSSMK